MNDNTYPDRAAVPGDVDFTMMYAAHDAFSRHLERVLADVEAGSRAAGLVRWQIFAHQLHVHHVAEDEVLWPALHGAVRQRAERAVLEAMELEHATIDPLIESFNAAFSGRGVDELAALLGELRSGLLAHMRHEENEALPLVAAHLGRAGWGAFGAAMRQRQGVKGAAGYLPWLLDGASPATCSAVLRVLPAPARLLYRLVWRPRYRRALT